MSLDMNRKHRCIRIEVMDISMDFFVGYLRVCEDAASVSIMDCMNVLR